MMIGLTFKFIICFTSDAYFYSCNENIVNQSTLLLYSCFCIMLVLELSQQGYLLNFYPNSFLNSQRFRIALKKTFPNCSRPVIGVLHTFLGQESSSNYSLGDIQLHLAIFARNRIASKSVDDRNK